LVFFLSNLLLLLLIVLWSLRVFWVLLRSTRKYSPKQTFCKPRKHIGWSKKLYR
jgi:steroid 5-alpha reductase family enzyme